MAVQDGLLSNCNIAESLFSAKCVELSLFSM